MSLNEVLVEVKNLKVVFGKGKNKFIAIDDVSFDIFKGETFGLVGESGSGKTTIGRAIMRINEVTEGQILYHGKKLNGKISKEWDREITQKIQMIFQDPMASLNERAKVDYIISEGLINTKNFKNEADRQQKVRDALLNVGLLPEFSSRFPHEFSGGQRQRIGIARALVMEPEFIIADEPVSALDVSVQSQVLNLMMDLQDEFHLTYLFISHDLSVVKHISDRVAVLYLGRVVEIGEKKELYENPLHPYTKALLSAIPVINFDHPKQEIPLQGELPSPMNPPVGCVFHTRCPYVMDRCRQERPVLQEENKHQRVACFLYDE